MPGSLFISNTSVNHVICWNLHLWCAFEIYRQFYSISLLQLQFYSILLLQLQFYTVYYYYNFNFTLSHYYNFHNSGVFPNTKYTDFLGGGGGYRTSSAGPGDLEPVRPSSLSRPFTCMSAAVGQYQSTRGLPSTWPITMNPELLASCSGHEDQTK